MSGRDLAGAQGAGGPRNWLVAPQNVPRTAARGVWWAGIRSCESPTACPPPRASGTKSDLTATADAALVPLVARNPWGAKDLARNPKPDPPVTFLARSGLIAM